MKKIVTPIIILLVAAVCWYLFIKPSDYIVRFTAPTTVGTVNQALKSWKLTKENVTLISAEKIDEITQEVRFGDSIHIYTWKMKALTDSTTRVVVGVKDAAHSIPNKLKVPFGNTPIKTLSEGTVRDFYNGLQDHLDAFKITLEGESTIPPSYAAYVTVKGTQLQKASGMMKYYGYLNTIMTQDGIEAKGAPFIEITDWDQKTDSITYNFCFPIKNKENLPEFPEVKYKRFLERKALKATYNGNYITSDRAWYRLLAFAKANNISVDALPVESFYNNPNFGGDEKNWKAEIYMPIKE